MSTPVLSARGLTKTYDGQTVLGGVSLDVFEGEIVGLVGENGAGKSTLLNLLSGVDAPDTGAVMIRGARQRLRSYRDAVQQGVYRVFQELALVPNLRVWENLFLANEQLAAPGLFLRPRQQREVAGRMLAHLDADIDISAYVSDLDFGDRQWIEILRCFCLAELQGVGRPVVLFDEPTASLGKTELEQFRHRLDSLRGKVTGIFVSHRLVEAIEVCDRLLVMKDGELVAEVDADQATETQLHELMVGRIREADYYHEEAQRPKPDDDVVLSVRDLTGARVRNINLDVHRGEILALAGVVGSGKEDVGRLVAGIKSTSAGSVTVNGRPLVSGSVSNAISAGVFYVPHDRHTEGVMLDLSVASNLSLPAITTHRLSRWGLLQPTRERRAVAEGTAAYGIRCTSPTQTLRSLSGGNQQKVSLARWATLEPTVLVLDNPTRGVDAGAKYEIYGLIRELAASGVAVLLIGDELPEVIGMSDRVLVMKDGQVNAELATPPTHKPHERQLIPDMV